MTGSLSFRAERLAPAADGHWALYLHSGDASVRIGSVVPRALGDTIDTDGVLGLIFDSAVSCVQVEVAIGASGAHTWHVWRDEGS
jgi:hypothetical protein